MGSCRCRQCGTSASFRRGKMNFGDAVQIKGCSVKSRFLESSSGNSSVDNLLGGALPNTSITIIDETQSRVYAETLTKYFLAEGLYNDHDLLVVDPCSSSADFYSGLPTKIDSPPSSYASLPSSSPSLPGESMKIAWRYESTRQVNSSIGSKNRYDLGKAVDELGQFQSKRMKFPEEEGAPCSYEGLFGLLRRLLASEAYSKDRGPKKNLLRVVVRNLGSPLWSDSENSSAFLARLRSITRNSYCLVMATTCSPTVTPDQVKELEVTADCFFRLVAITDEEKKAMPSLDKFHGYFHIVSLPRLTSAATHCPSAVDLVFELHRRSFDVKILHLPPALGGPDPAVPAKTACGNIDF